MSASSLSTQSHPTSETSSEVTTTLSWHVQGISWAEEPASTGRRAESLHNHESRFVTDP